jgi:hypothetical protein
MDIEDPIGAANRHAAERAAADKQRIEASEVTFYNCFSTKDGRLVLKELREQLQVEAASFSLRGRENRTINEQRDAMKMVYWMIFNLAERGANRVGDTFRRRD